MIRPRSRLRVLTLAMAALGAFSGCKKDDASKAPAAADRSAPIQNPYIALSTPLEVAPVGITLTTLEGSTVNFGALATDRIVVVVPWVQPQTDAMDRLNSVRDSAFGLSGVRILPVLIEKAPTAERLAELSAQSAQMGIPFYVDAEHSLIKFINANLKRRPSQKSTLSIPSYVVLTEGVRRITVAPKERATLRGILDEALIHILPTEPPPLPATEVSVPPADAPAAAAPSAP